MGPSITGDADVLLPVRFLFWKHKGVRKQEVTLKILSMPMTWPVPIAFFSSDICTSVYSIILEGLPLLVVITSLMKLLLGNMLRTENVISNGLAGIFWGLLFLSLLYLAFWVIRWSIISSGVSRLTSLLTSRGALPCWTPCLIIIFCWDVSCL